MSKIIFYTNHACPFAHRAHIALAELGLGFEEVIIDLNKPREPWYLEINPRGLVPALKYGDHLITESLVITQFLADLKESHLLPSSGSLKGALARARINFFVDTFSNKITSLLFTTIRTLDNEEEKIAKANQLVDAIEKEITPLLADAAPFFGGSKELTFAEVNTAPFVLRTYKFAEPEAGILPAFVLERLKANKVWNDWAEAVLARQNVTSVWEDDFVEKMKQRLASTKK